MSNQTMPAIIAGLFSFAAAIGVSYLLFGEQETSLVPAPDSSALEARISALESKKATIPQRRSSASVESPKGQDAFDASSLEARLDALEEAKKLEVIEGAKEAMGDGDTEFSKSLKLALPNALEALRKEERTAKHLKSVDAFKDKSSAILTGALDKYADTVNLSDSQRIAVEAAYAERVDSLFSLYDEIRAANASGQPIPKEDLVLRIDQIVETNNASLAGIVDEDQAIHIQNAFGSADWYARKGNDAAGFSEDVWRRMNPEVVQRKNSSGRNKGGK